MSRLEAADPPLTIDSRPRKLDQRPRIDLSCLVQSGPAIGDSIWPSVWRTTRGGRRCSSVGAGSSCAENSSDAHTSSSSAASPGSLIGQPNQQILLSAIILQPITVRTEQLQVIQVVGAAARSWEDVIHVEHLERDLQIAAIAPARPAPNTPGPLLPSYSLFAPPTC